MLDIINFPDYIPSIKFTFDLCNEMRYPAKRQEQHRTYLSNVT